MRTLVLLTFLCCAVTATAQKPELIAQQEGHLAEIQHVGFSPDGRQVLSAGQDDRIILWDLNSRKFVRYIQTAATPNFFCFSPDGLTAIALLADNSLNAWSLASGERLWSATLSGKEPVSIQVSPDHHNLAIGFGDRSVGCWDLSIGRQRWKNTAGKKQPAIVYFSPDGTTIVTRDENGNPLSVWLTQSGEKQAPAAPMPGSSPLSVIRGNKAVRLGEKNMLLIDFQKNINKSLPQLAQKIAEMNGRERGGMFNSGPLQISDFIFTPDANTAVIAVGTPTMMWGTTPGMPMNRSGFGALLFWDTQHDRLLHAVDTLAEIVNGLEMSADGNHFLTAGSDRTVRLYDIRTGQELARLERRAAVETNFRFTPDFRRVAMTNYHGAFKLWDLDQRENLYVRPPQYSRSSTYSAPDIDAFLLSPNGMQLYTGNRNFSVDTWTVPPLEHQNTLKDRHDCTWVTTALSLSPDGHRLLVASSQEWRAMAMMVKSMSPDSIQGYITNASNDTIGFKTAHGAVYGQISNYPGFQEPGAPTPAKPPVNWAPDYDQLSLWDLDKGASVQVFYAPHDGWVNKVSTRFSPDGRLALKTIENKTMAWDIETGARLINTAGTDWFYAAYFDEKLARALSTGPNSATTLWDLHTGQVVKQFSGLPPVAAAGFNPGGNRICSWSADNTLTEWAAATGTIIRQLHNVSAGASIEYAPDTNFVVLRAKGAVSVWNLNTGTPALQLGNAGATGYVSDLFYEDHRPEQVNSFAFLPDGWRAVSTTYDGVIRFWNYRNGQEIGTVFFLNENDWVITTPSGLFDASAGAMQQLYYRVGAEVVELEQLKERYYEPGLLQKLLGFANGALRDVEQFAAVELYPLIRANIDGGQLRVDLQERNGGLGKLSLFVNGKEVQEDINTDRQKSLAIGLDGFSKYYRNDTLNSIALRAYNAQNWLKSQAYQLSYQPVIARGGGGTGSVLQPLSGAAKPQLYVLAIGTSDYSGEQLDLRFADKDAAAIAEALRAAGEALFTARRVHVQLLSTAAGNTDENPGAGLPSKANIRAAFANLADKTNPGDLVVVYFSGHGLTYGPAEKALFYYLTKDIANENLNDPEIRNNYAISSDELTQWLTAIPAQKQVLILDACNSGKIVEALAAVAARELNPSQIRAFDRMKDRTGMFILTGSAANKVSYEASQYGQGLLTYSLLEGMSGLALTSDKRVDVMTLFQYSRDKVPDLAKGIGGIQTPVLAFPTDGGSFDIGIVNDQVKIPVARIKPVFIQNIFLDEQRFDDGLDLSAAMADYFRAITAKGAQAEIIYVDVNQYENAYSIRGLYTVQGSQVHVRGRLFNGKTGVGDFSVEGRTDAVPELIERIVEQVWGLVK